MISVRRPGLARELNGASQSGAWGVLPVWSVAGRFLSFLSSSGAAATVAPLGSFSPPWGKPIGGSRESSDESSVRPGR